MNRLEIRLNKKGFVVTIIYLLLLVVSTSYFVYLTDYFSDNKIVRLMAAPVSLGLLIYAMGFLKKILDNSSSILLDPKCIEIKLNNKSTRYYWHELSELSFNKEKGKGYFMILKGPNGERCVNLDMFEKKPHEIEEIVKSYRSMA